VPVSPGNVNARSISIADGGQLTDDELVERHALALGAAREITMKRAGHAHEKLAGKFFGGHGLGDLAMARSF
jgi:hypothetical protein